MTAPSGLREPALSIPCVLALPGNEALAAQLCAALPAQAGALQLRAFPDGESYVRVQTAVAGRCVLVVATLDRPDSKLIPLYLLCKTLRELGAARIVLVAPYLAYMRQDVRFHDGEAISARAIGDWLTPVIDDLLTVDPHLHRIHDLSEVYRLRTQVIAAAPAIVAYLREQLPRALLIGPDSESEQWVAEVAAAAGCAYCVLAKTRHGDREVEIAVPARADWAARTPVLIDDIISTGRTMIAAMQALREVGAAAPWCIGVHAIFAGDAYAELQAAGAARIVTANTIVHPSNAIDLAPYLVARVAAALTQPGRR